MSEDPLGPFREYLGSMDDPTLDELIKQTRGVHKFMTMLFEEEEVQGHTLDIHNLGPEGHLVSIQALLTAMMGNHLYLLRYLKKLENQDRED